MGQWLHWVMLGSKIRSAGMLFSIPIGITASTPGGLKDQRMTLKGP